jgi:hypothetical protein
MFGTSAVYHARSCDDIRLFSYTELMSLLCGQQYVKPADLVKLLRFERFATSSTFPDRFRDLVSTFSSEDCKRFLVFITAQSALPVNKNIDVRYGRFAVVLLGRCVVIDNPHVDTQENGRCNRLSSSPHVFQSVGCSRVCNR